MAAALVRRRVALLPSLAARPPSLAARLCTAARTLDTPFVSDTIPLAEGVLGTVDALMKEPGAAVEENEIIAAVETDKVVLDIKASQSGVVAEVLVEVGDTVKEMQPLYSLED